jgi:hypothetical protein
MREFAARKQAPQPYEFLGKSSVATERKVSRAGGVGDHVVNPARASARLPPAELTAENYAYRDREHQKYAERDREFVAKPAVLPSVER